MTTEEEKNKELQAKWEAEWGDIVQKETWNKFIAFLLKRQRYFNAGLLSPSSERDRDMYIKGQINGLDIAINAKPEDIFAIKKKPTGQPAKAP